MIWHWKMLLRTHGGTETEQWGLNVILLLRKTSVFTWHFHITLQSEIRMLYQTEERHRRWICMTVCYRDTYKLIAYYALSNATECTSRKKTKTHTEVTETWKHGERLVWPNHAVSWKTTDKVPCHNKAGSIFSFFVCKIMSYVLRLFTFKIWWYMEIKDGSLVNAKFYK